MSATDAALLTEILKVALEEGEAGLLSASTVEARAEGIGLQGAVFEESLRALGESYHLVLSTDAGDRVYQVELTHSGYRASISWVVPDVDEVELRLVAVLVNDPPGGNDAIADLMRSTGAERLVVDQLLRDLESRRLVSVTRTIGGGAVIWKTSPTLWRLLD